jgi:hypothetical protein
LAGATIENLICVGGTQSIAANVFAISITRQQLKWSQARSYACLSVEEENKKMFVARLPYQMGSVIASPDAWLKSMLISDDIAALNTR